jgi:hypothetical protein
MSMGQSCGVQNIIETFRPVIELATNTSANLQVAQQNHNNLISYVMYMESQMHNNSLLLSSNIENTQVLSS